MMKEEMLNLIRKAFTNHTSYPSDEAIDKIACVAIECEIEKNSTILNMWEEQREVYLISTGIVRSYYLDNDGNDVTKSFMMENDFCVGESLFDKGRSSQVFEAIEPVKALRFHAATLKDIILNDKYLTTTYLEYLEKTLIYKMNRESAFQIMSATERYIQFLNSYKKIENRVNQSYIASYLGIAPESLSRIKRTLKEVK